MQRITRLATVLTSVALTLPALAQGPVSTWNSPDLVPDQEFVHDPYGKDIELSGDWVVVRSSEAFGVDGIRKEVCVYSASTGALLHELGTPTASYSFFGHGINVDGSLALVGGADGNGFAHVYDLNTGALISELRSPGPNPDSLFGQEVALSGAIAVVGAGNNPTFGSAGRTAYAFDALTGADRFQLVPKVGDPSDDFGFALAIEGTRIVVGAPRNDTAGVDSGAIYVFDANTGAELLMISPGVLGERFGTDVALEGNVVVGLAASNRVVAHDLLTGQFLYQIQASQPDGNWGRDMALDDGSLAIISGCGSGTCGVSLFDSLTGAFVDFQPIPSGPAGIDLDGGRLATQGTGVFQTLKIFGLVSVVDPASDQTLLQLGVGNTATFDGFGTALDVHAARAVVGAPRDWAVGFDSGSAYVYDTATGAALSTLRANDAGQDQWFGAAVGLDDQFCVVGAPLFGNGNKGAAYLFSLATGAQLQKLQPSSAATGDVYGTSVAVANGVAAIGAPNNAGKGSAFVFDLATGTEMYTLTGSGLGALRFGTSLALDGNRLLVGAPQTGGTGGAYLFDTSTGAELLELIPFDALPSEAAGVSVAKDGNFVLLGSLRDNPFFSQAGAAYVFDAANGAQLFTLTPPDGLPGKSFGSTVAVSGELALVGAPSDKEFGFGTGAIYAFDLRDGSFVTKLNGPPSAGFAAALVVENGLIHAGEPSNGVVTLHTPPTLAPLIYCTAKASSAGCQASIGTFGPTLQPVSGAADYSLTANGTHSFKTGLAFASLSGSAAIPFLGGTLCVTPPTKRGPLVSSGGVGFDTCTGSYTTTINDGNMIQGAVNGLDGGPGASVWYQWWYRDPAGGSGSLGSALSNAVRVDFL